MRPIVFTGMLMQAVPPSEAVAADLEPGAAGKQVDALIRSLDGHFDRDAVGPLQAALVRDRERLARIRSKALLRAAIDELTVQAEAGDTGLPSASEEMRNAA